MVAVFEMYPLDLDTGRIEQKKHIKFLLLFIVISFLESHSSITHWLFKVLAGQQVSSTKFLERSMIPEINDSRLKHYNI